MTVIYNGLLADETVRRVRECAGDGFRFGIEVKKLPRDKEFVDALKTREWITQHEDCMGGEYRRENTGSRYLTVIDKTDFLEAPRGPNHELLCGGFLMFMDDEDRQAAITVLGDNVINADPFKTVVR